MLGINPKNLRNWIGSHFGESQNRRGSTNIAGLAIILCVGLLVAASVLPTALGTWYNVTAAGGALATAPSMVKTLWDLVPPMVVVAILAIVVSLGLHKMGRI